MRPGDPWCGAMAEAMLAGEEAEGRKGVWPMDKRRPAWFHAEDWLQWPVIAIGNGEVHIVAVHGARKGAFGRLVREVQQARLVPVVVEPMGREMPAILAKHGWVHRQVGEGWDAREEWRPASSVERIAA